MRKIAFIPISYLAGSLRGRRTVIDLSSGINVWIYIYICMYKYMYIYIYSYIINIQYIYILFQLYIYILYNIMYIYKYNIHTYFYIYRDVMWVFGRSLQRCSSDDEIDVYGMGWSPGSQPRWAQRLWLIMTAPRATQLPLWNGTQVRYGQIQCIKSRWICNLQKPLAPQAHGRLCFTGVEKGMFRRETLPNIQ